MSVKPLTTIRFAFCQENAKAEIERVAVLLTVILDDSESQHPGGWGPDVTTVVELREARNALLKLIELWP
jgi:hypothetical protein